jgi:hypothetical protein
MKKATITVVDPSSVEIDVRLTMSVKAAKELRDAIYNRPGSIFYDEAAEIGAALTEAVQTVEREFVGMGHDDAREVEE